MASDPSRKPLWVSEWRGVREARGPDTPVATGSMRNLLRAGELLALRGAYDGVSRRLREHTRGCRGK